MTREATEARLLERALAHARRARPPSLSDADAAALVRRAARIAGSPPRSLGSGPVARGAVVAVAMAAAAVLGIALGPGGEVDPSKAEGPKAAAPMELALPTGDRLTVLEGSAFELVSVTPEARRVSLARGAMVLDVARLGDGARFEVETPHARVRVLGTVFGVEVSEAGTTIRVFEGRVEVVRGDARRVLDAGEHLATGDAIADVDPRLEMAADRARAARAIEGAVEPTAAEVGATEPTAVEPADSAPPSPAPEARVVVASSSAAGPGGRAPAPLTLREAERLIAASGADRALEAARAALAADPGAAPWRRVEADALRALRRFVEAADAYDAAARASAEPGERAGCGFRAALVRRAELGDARGAVASLDAARVDEPGSPFEERGLALRARALLDLGREDDAREVARRYLARFPHGTTATFLAPLVEPGAPAD